MRLALLITLLLAAGSASAARLSCDLSGDALGSSPRIQQFQFSSANETGEVVDRVQSSAGTVRFADGKNFQTAITVNGAPVNLPENFRGLIRFGEVRDYGDNIAIAYLVERGEDSSAMPSEVALLVNGKGQVIRSDILPGNGEQTDGYCNLIR